MQIEMLHNEQAFSIKEDQEKDSVEQYINFIKQGIDLKTLYKQS